MYNAGDDTDQNVLPGLASSDHARRPTATIRTGNQFWQDVSELISFSLSSSCRLAHEDVFDTPRINLFYTRFIMVPERLAALLGEIERRAAAH